MNRLPDSADNIYVNVSFINNPIQPGASDSSIPISSAIAKNTSIIPDGSLYYLTVVNFSVPLIEIPLFIAPVIANSGSAQTMPLILGIFDGTTNFPVNLIYTGDSNITLPNQNDPLRQVESDGYWVYSYEKLASLLNVALSTAYTNSGSLGGNGAPFFRYNSPLERLELIVNQAFLAAGGIIFMNSWTNKYIQSRRAFFYGYDLPQGRDLDFITPLDAQYNIDFPVGFTTNPPTISSNLVYIQEWQSLQNISSVRQLLVTASSLKCQPEYIPFGNQSQNNSSTLPIISSFLPSFDSPGSNQSRAIYTPFLYRFLDVQSTSSISQLDINFYWQDEFDDIHPIFLGVGETASIKLAFIKKELVKSQFLVKKF